MSICSRWISSGAASTSPKIMYQKLALRPPRAIRFINLPTNQPLRGVSLFGSDYDRCIVASLGFDSVKRRMLERIATTSLRDLCCKDAIREAKVARSSEEEDRPTAKLVVAAAITLVLGVGNQVLYKLALVPLRHYPFCLAQLATFWFDCTV